MRTREEALSYGLSFPDTYQDAPFHDENWQLVRYKGNKKAFLWTYERDGFINLNVKVEPDKAFFWRDIYESVMPGYHQMKNLFHASFPGIVKTGHSRLFTIIAISFIFEDSKKNYYYRELPEWRNEKGWLSVLWMDIGWTGRSLHKRICR